MRFLNHPRDERNLKQIFVEIRKIERLIRRQWIVPISSGIDLNILFLDLCRFRKAIEATVV